MMRKMLCIGESIDVSENLVGGGKACHMRMPEERDEGESWSDSDSEMGGTKSDDMCGKDVELLMQCDRCENKMRGGQTGERRR